MNGSGGSGFEAYDATWDIDCYGCDVSHSGISGFIYVNRDGLFGWSNNGNPRYATSNTLDTGISRVSAGVIAIGNGTPADFSGEVELTNLYVAPVAIASLPPAPTAGDFATVNDALGPVVGNAVVAGGAAFAAVCYNGAAWKVFVV